MKSFIEYLDVYEGLLSDRKKKVKEGEEEKIDEPLRIFSVGDIVQANTTEGGKLPDEVKDFLTTYKEYEVIDVKENGKISLGCKVCHNEDGKEKDFLFSPKRFRLKGEEKLTEVPKKKNQQRVDYGYGYRDDPEDEPDFYEPDDQGDGNF